MYKLLVIALVTIFVFSAMLNSVSAQYSSYETSNSYYSEGSALDSSSSEIGYNGYESSSDGFIN